MKSVFSFIKNFICMLFKHFICYFFLAVCRETVKNHSISFGNCHNAVIYLVVLKVFLSLFCFTFLSEDGFHPVINDAARFQADAGTAVAVFIQRHDHNATSGQFNGIGRAGFMVILVTVKQQYARAGIIGGYSFVAFARFVV